MSSVRNRLRGLGLVLAFTAGTSLLILGVAWAQEEFLCVGPTENGCSEVACKKPVAKCQNKDYAGYEQEGFQFRRCQGDPGNCEGLNYSFVSCEIRFYMSDGMNLCAVEDCGFSEHGPRCPP